MEQAQVTEDQASKSPQLSRRGFLGATLAATFGLIIGKEVGTHAATMIKENYFEHDGIRYFPIYENHKVGPEVQLPDQTNGIFMEQNIDINIVDPSVEEIVIIKHDIYDLPADRIAKGLNVYLGTPVAAGTAMMRKVSELKIPIGLGDIDLNSDEFVQLFRHTRNVEDTRNFYGGIATIISSQLPEVLRKKVEQRAANTVPRRQFLKWLGLGTAATGIGGAGFGTWLATDTRYFADLTNNESYPEPIKNLLLRLNGMATLLHPEDTVTFMRDVIMALKIKNMAEYIKGNFHSTSQDKPLVAYNVGKAHNGIEDLIGLPSGILRNIFAFINRDYLNKAFKRKGENLAVTRLIQADDKGEYHDLARLVDNELLSMIGQG